MPKPGSSRYLTFATNSLLSDLLENKIFHKNFYFSSKLFVTVKNKIFLKMKQILALHVLKIK